MRSRFPPPYMHKIEYFMYYETEGKKVSNLHKMPLGSAVLPFLMRSFFCVVSLYIKLHEDDKYFSQSFNMEHMFYYFLY